MGTNQLKALKRLQKENDRLRRAVSDLTQDKLILLEAARGVMVTKELILRINSGPNGRNPEPLAPSGLR
ncbi:hypothetical protein RSK20926_21255 [Roseobacter sp. SK209-2-6]|nr:hypothetical protein RSK20926_21255 [Roseobacter sp. SK209-2-6]